MGKRSGGKPRLVVGRLIIAALVGAIFVVTILLFLRAESRDEATSIAPGPSVAGARVATRIARRETRPTLDPARFVGKAAAAHRVAREMPDVLDQLYCYCSCDKSIGHKSLLSCYTDGHAAT
jgi:hypothetical protein